MAIGQDNSLIRIRGKAGGLVYKWYGDRLVVTQVPRPSKKKPTKQQQAGRKRFALASRYAEEARADAALWKLYEAAAKQRRVPTRAIAIHDYLSVPAPVAVSLSGYAGREGGRILLVLQDRFSFKTVKIAVVLRGSDGAIVEQGAAQQAAAGSWSYLATKPGGRTRPVTIEVVASDRFGKTAAARFVGMPGTRVVPAEPNERARA